VRLSVRCGTRLVRRSVKVRNGRWSASVTCAPKAKKVKKGKKAKAPVVRVQATYPGDPVHARSTVTRQVKVAKAKASAKQAKRSPRK
jgi:hypothetical protein